MKMYSPFCRRADVDIRKIYPATTVTLDVKHGLLACRFHYPYHRR